MVKDGKTLDDIDLNEYMGDCRIYSKTTRINSNQGLLFKDTNITEQILKDLIKTKPKFVGLSEDIGLLFTFKRLNQSRDEDTENNNGRNNRY